jgi:TonB family protein
MHRMLAKSAGRRGVARISNSLGHAALYALSAWSTWACSGSPPPSAEAPAPEPASSAPEPAEEGPSAGTPEGPGSVDSETTPSGGAAASKPPADTRTQESINAVVQANRQKVRDCYDAALKSSPANAGAAGDLVVSFVIDPEGKVKEAEVNWSQSEIHIPELDTCAAAAIRSLTFPPSSKGMESKVNYPFNLNPKGPATTTPKKPEGAK